MSPRRDAPDWPDWDDLRVFAAVAEAGSLTAGAAALGISQPTAGRRLKALEERLGLRLLDRVSNRTELTEAGRRLKAHLPALVEAADALVQEARQIRDGAPEPVRISATGSVSLFLASVAGELLRDCGVPLELMTGKERANLARRSADIALRMRRLPDEGDLTARRLARLAFAIYGPAGVDPAGLAVIGLPRNERPGSQAQTLDAWAGSRPVLLRLDDPGLRLRAALSAGAATLLPCFLGDAEPALARLDPPLPHLAEDVWLLVHARMRTTAPVEKAAAGLAALFRRHRDKLDGSGD